MKSKNTTFWKNYELYNKVVGNSSMRSTVDAVLLWKLFQEFKFNRCLEIGVYQGLTSGLILESNATNTLIGIDPILQLNLFNLNYSSAITNRAKFISANSQELEINDTFDFILIDGDHTANVAYCDLIKYIPMLDKNGVLAIDDYALPGVKKAINMLKTELVPFLQCEQTEYWHYPCVDRSDFLDGLLSDKISKFIFLYNIKTSTQQTILKAKTIEALTDNIDLFDIILKIYDI